MKSSSVQSKWSRSHLKVLVLASFLTLIPTAAHADAHFGIHFGSSPGGFYRHGGYWSHSHYNGRYGWWYVSNNYWHPYARPYYYDYPRTEVVYETAPPTQVVMQSAPQPVIVQSAPPPAPPAPSYYCKATGTYYPETTTCPGGWMTSIAGSPPAMIPAQ